MSETSPTQRGLLITMPSGPRAAIPTHLVFPDWLFAEDSILSKLFDSEETAREAYARYYTDANSGSQEEFGRLLARNISDACKEFPANKEGVYTREFQNGLRSAVMNAFYAWYNNYANVLDDVGLHNIYMCVNFPGTGYPEIVSSSALAMLVEGHVPLNFLAVLSQKSCQRAFEMAMITLGSKGLEPLPEPMDIPDEEPEAKE